MRQYSELTVVEQGVAVDKELCSLLEAVTEGAIHFDDEANGDNLQAAIDKAWERAGALQTPWFAHEHIMDAAYEGPMGGDTVREVLRGMAQCSAEDALYPGPDEHVIRL